MENARVVRMLDAASFKRGPCLEPGAWGFVSKLAILCRFRPGTDLAPWWNALEDGNGSLTAGCHLVWGRDASVIWFITLSTFIYRLHHIDRFISLALSLSTTSPYKRAEAKKKREGHGEGKKQKFLTLANGAGLVRDKKAQHSAA
ncbi:hypothetical protein MGYG_05977 [Nannizzia gypsea CBS 118893]|uniref:Uncharacterized protein n=1 Tax=Arthroderma gypseum (strain ATCC MYA-4604 / CBS 118893) TaxID=535722 RepID=E4V041_ARTGP|nr:hypothetical protein MGYG_05977 [Nannizzia gypsea CBS 118893]EFR02978.1 hypothetical protein MGYG_05977 [Nannizzia gypsea CBS 118893]